MSADEQAAVAVAEPEEESSGATKVPSNESSSRILVLGAAALALAALIAAILFGVMWWVAANDDNADLAASREAVVKAGTNALKAYTEVDYQDLDGFFARQKSVSDATMSQQIDQSAPTFRKALSDAKTKVTTDVQDIAVEELDDHEGKASFLAAIATTVTQGDKSSAKPLRLEVSMTRVGDDWKLSGIDSVPLVAAGQ
ncbi:MAG: Mce-associated rane protein [Actinomycetota bacterium]|jgi:Mce-associated membrane protein|nr:Mce-associated rane protein [Actinomycetota bacterium]